MFSTKSFSVFVWLFAALLLLALPCRAVEKGNEGDERPSVENGPDGLPKYKHPYKDGLYSTVTAMNMFWVPEVEAQKKVKLKVPGFRKEYPVFSILQKYQAPLIVILLGVDGKVDGPWGNLFPYWYSEAGYNVLTFDSSFTPLYPELAGKGVVGNFEAEAEQAGEIIAAFLKTPEAAKVVTDVGVVGMSFGATQALLLAARAKAGKLPFKLSGCLALSPPVSLRTAAKTVDRFFREDRWDTTMIELAKKFGTHAPVAEGEPNPFSATEMRAAIGFVFRDGLTKVVERNDRAFKLKILPSADGEENRNTYAEATGFQRYVEVFAAPYWQKNGAVKTADELWEIAELSKILPRLPDYAEAIVAANDPFNTPEELAAAKAADAQGRLTVLPSGGHLGFVAADWTLVKALRIFKNRAPQEEVQDRRTPDQARKEALDAAREAVNREVPPKK